MTTKSYFDTYFQINSLYDAISISAIGFNLFALFMLFFNDWDFLIGLILVLVSQYVIKELTIPLDISILKRPLGACNCSLYNLGGNVDGKPGFPSGHVSGSSFMTNLIYFKFCKQKNLWNYILYNFWNIFMGIARYQKKCHNLIQIIGGYIFGLIVAYLFYEKDTLFSLSKQQRSFYKK